MSVKHNITKKLHVSAEQKAKLLRKLIQELKIKLLFSLSMIYNKVSSDLEQGAWEEVYFSCSYYSNLGSSNGKIQGKLKEVSFHSISNYTNLASDINHILQNEKYAEQIFPLPYIPSVQPTFQSERNICFTLF